MKRRYKISLSLSLTITAGIVIILLVATNFNPSPSTDGGLVIRVGQYDNPPKIYEDDQGNVIGLFPDLLGYIAVQEGWTIEYVKGTWTECLDRLENNTIDIMVDVAYSDERAEKYDFNNVEILSNWGIIYRKKGSNIESIDDLENKKIAVMEGSIHTEGEGGIKSLVNKWGINCTFIELENYYQVFEILDEGGAEVGIVNRLFGLLNENDYYVEKTQIMFNPRKLMFAFPKNAEMNQILIPRIDEQLLKLKEDPNSLYFIIIDKYIYGHEAIILPEWLILSLIFSIGLLITFISASFILNRAVKSRTAELQKAHNELEIKVAERTKELKYANIRLKDLDRIKSMFLASMSHELRTPLNSIIGFTGWLLMGMEGDLNEEQKKQLTMVENSADHLLGLINDILDISKIEAGKVELVIEKFKIAEVVNDVVSSVLPLAKDKGLKLIYDFPEELVLNSDKRRIKQILMNLVSNAIKFTDQGIVKIMVKSLNNKDLEVIVSDSGIGIKKEDIELLFKPFQQVDMSSTKKHGGTGLGLHLCKKLIELLHGDISVKSQFGEGSEFKFIIPIKFKEVV